MALAFACMLLGIITLGILGTLPSVLRYGPRYAMLLLEMLPVYLLFAVPGWVMALPFVLAFKDAERWRGWAIVLIGTAIGPAVIGALLLRSIPGAVTWDHAAHHLVDWKTDGIALMMALLIGFLTSAFYVIGLRYASARSSRKVA